MNDKKYTGLGWYGPTICIVEENFEVMGLVANWQPISLCFLQHRLMQHHTTIWCAMIIMTARQIGLATNYSNKDIVSLYVAAKLIQLTITAFYFVTCHVMLCHVCTVASWV